MARCFLATTLALVLCLCWLPNTGIAGAAEDREGQRKQINNLIRLEQRDSALRECRLYVQANPDDAMMQYNLACLENTQGDKERAEVAFRAAIAAGFIEYDAALVDVDLQGDLHSKIQEIIVKERSLLAERAMINGYTLSYNTWSDPHELRPHSSTPSPSSVDPQMRLQWQDKGLAFELTGDTNWESAIDANNSPPWQGGPGMMITLGVPEDEHNWDVTNHYIFAFGLENKGGVGGLFLPSQNTWQRVRELAPKIRVDEGGKWLMTGLIPWQVIAPYYPVVDTPLGLNATLYTNGPQGTRRVSLLETNDTLVPQAANRRMVRLDFATDTLQEDLFLGKLSTSLSTSDTGGLDVNLVAISTESGSGTLSINFIDQSGRSVLPEGAIRGKVSLENGTNKIVRQADFSALNTGGYVITAELTFPSGKKAIWSGTVLQLQEGWQASYEDRISYVGYSEQATARHLFGKILESLAAHESRRSPGPILTAMFTLDNMLTDAQESGTILPDKGVFTFVYPGPDGNDRLCRMYLPAGRQHADAVNPIVILNPYSGQDAQLASRIGRNYEFGDQNPTLKTGDDDKFPIYLVPEMPTAKPGNPIDYLGEADACRRFFQEFFNVRSLAVVGVDKRGDAALSLATRLSIPPLGLLIFAGEELEPWPMAQPEYIREKLGPAPENLPITWVSFTQEVRRAGQGREILQALRDLNYNIVESKEVRGGLNLTQVADRIVIWAEGLR
ncbi:MAG: hypothetical protein ACI9UK_000782 [Candidatus Krumholzibacteriia bacterium]|jgi:hypothetical protein